MKNRIVYNNAGSLTDYSSELNNYYSGTVTIAFSSTNYLYIGSTLPFNSIYFEITSGNTNTATIDVDHWDGDEWKSCAEVIDETSYSGKTLYQSGTIKWTTDKDNTWARDDSNEMTSSGISSLKIYDMFWVRLNPSADLSTTTISWAGNIFSNDSQLGTEFPDLVRTTVKQAFSASKTDWKEQHYLAAEIIKKDLIHRKVIADPNQILDVDDLKEASVQKVAQIIYNALGDDYVDNRNDSEKEYIKRLERAFVKVDTNMNARVDTQEQRPTNMRFYR